MACAAARGAWCLLATRNRCATNKKGGWHLKRIFA
eukprot:CAMPEP_0203983310 /NCGR_PEP_ID=MMETSP0360-20130528/3726_1 /ASSEMBLY_ACC=CAM_ASM_000342 /TAXON_ID=268821 /ORGANISM="Scrippsiella Hangoei, Strain SHTV-5" /LENGTH=34 /DNA_ID= /DNA_START= /DNA_END= /DNA_ORIENTATION=